MLVMIHGLIWIILGICRSECIPISCYECRILQVAVTELRILAVTAHWLDLISTRLADHRSNIVRYLEMLCNVQFHL